MKNEEKKCNLCGKMYYIQESYGVNGSDEYYATEVGHAWSCDRRNIDPNNVPYIQTPK